MKKTAIGKAKKTVKPKSKSKAKPSVKTKVNFTAKTKDEKVLDSKNDVSVRVKIIKDKCAYLYKMGKPFTLIKGGSTYELISSMWNERAFRRGVFKPADLTFIRAVRTYVEKNFVADKFLALDYKSSGINYIKVNKFKIGEKVEGLVYLDLNMAYWQTALILGVINTQMFKRGLDVNKVVRLAALGSLAKTKSVWKYDGKNFKQTDTLRSTNTENIWFAICKRVSDVMSQAVRAVGKDFVFYWVDGIYIKDNAVSVNKIAQIFRDCGYDCKIANVPYVEFHDKGFKVQGALQGDIKEFSWDVSGKKGGNKPITKYLENKRLLALAKSIMYAK
jgi:hypothetical protein